MSPSDGVPISLGDLAKACGVPLSGDGAVLIDRVATLDGADKGAIAFLSNPKYRNRLATTRASAVIVSPEDAPGTALPKLIADNPYATYARVAAILHPASAPAPGVHPTAVIAPDARVAASAAIEAHAVVGGRTLIGERASVGAGTVIGEDCSVGADCVLHPRVVLYPRTQVGARTVVHSGAVIGADGFGMAEQDGRWLKVPQIGRTLVGADVEIGANTTIDRGAIGDTVIEDGVKLDNQIQIAHNCVIGANTVIAGCTGISGSTTVGRDCMIGGGVGLVGHITIADHVTISGFSLITKSITEPGTYTSGLPFMPHAEWLRNAVHLRRLDKIAKAARNAGEDDE